MSPPSVIYEHREANVARRVCRQGRVGRSGSGDSTRSSWVGTLCYNQGSALLEVFSRTHSAGSAIDVGEWLSLVEHLVRDQGVGGSNPLSPTNLSLTYSISYAAFAARFAAFFGTFGTTDTEYGNSKPIPNSSALFFRKPCCPSPCRRDRPSNYPRAPTSSREGPWGMRFHSSGTCSGNAGTRGFPPCDLPCSDSRSQASSAPDASGDEECSTARAASRTSSGIEGPSFAYR